MSQSSGVVTSFLLPQADSISFCAYYNKTSCKLHPFSVIFSEKIRWYFAGFFAEMDRG